MQEQGIEEGAKILLDDFWSNYAAYKGNVNYLSNIEANLDARLGAVDAATTIHYALNVGLANPDSVYEEVVEDSIDVNCALAADQTISKSNICYLVDIAKNNIKAFANNISVAENGGKSINRIEVEGFIEGNTFRVKVKYRISKGQLYSVGNMGAYPNNASTYFTSSIPWVTKKSTGAANYSQYTSTNNRYFNWLLFGDETTKFSQNPVLFQNSWNRLPDGNAGHHRLSNRNVFWPNPLAQLAGWYPYYPNTKPVMSPKYVTINGVLKPTLVEVKGFAITDPLRAVHATDLADCSNPFQPNNGVGLSTNPADMLPSKLLGWYKSEYEYGLTSVRQIPATAMNYFWSNKSNVVVFAQGKAQPSITVYMAYLNSGFYAINDLEYLPNPSANGDCRSQILCSELCLHRADYKVYTTFAHYTLQFKVPSVLLPYF